jgi:hypothetical protein
MALVRRTVVHIHRPSTFMVEGHGRVHRCPITEEPGQAVVSAVPGQVLMAMAQPADLIRRRRYLTPAQRQGHEYRRRHQQEVQTPESV